ncbi:DnaJ C-terminal domain-containing protein [Dactylosporangium sp. NPDC049525]|uniref:caspase, EACC1-associated type n=1 Tax=Dactylosporangium sp. NPDC049525 TaxID=3154730 RepID=UPI00342CED0B
MTGTLPDPRASRAVLVGVSRYQRHAARAGDDEGALDDLPTVRNNIAGLRRLLQDTSRWGLPRAHCRVLNQPSSSAEVLDVLREQADRATDTLLFYFAGHGLIDDRDEDEVYLALPGADRLRPNRESIPFKWIRNEFLDASRARRKVAIIDCCYSGRALGTWMSPDGPTPDGLEIFGTCVLTATARTRLALAPDNEPYTAFTGELIEALKNGIPDGPELLDLDTLYRHIYQRLRARGRPIPKRGERDTGGLVAIARNVAYRPGARSTPSAPHPTVASGQKSAADPSRTGAGAQFNAAPQSGGAPHPPAGRRRVVIEAGDGGGRQRHDPDTFERVFGVQERSTSDLSVELPLSVRECVFGTTIDLTLERSVPCGVCGGTGEVVNSRCLTCSGAKRNRQLSGFALRIPAGVRAGQTLRVRGQGNHGEGGHSAGDLYVTVREKAGPLRSAGDNLHYQLTVPMALAALGGTMRIPILDGHEVLRLEPGTQPGSTILVQGQGLPRAAGAGRGNLEIHVDVPTPTDLTATQRLLLDEFVATRPDDRGDLSGDLFRGYAFARLPMAVAALGTTLRYKAYDGTVTVRLQPGVQHGDRVPFSGGRTDGLGSSAGSIRVTVVVPAAVRATEREILRAFAEERGELPPTAAAAPPPRVPRQPRRFVDRLRDHIDGLGD